MTATLTATCVYEYDPTTGKTTGTCGQHTATRYNRDEVEDELARRMRNQLGCGSDDLCMIHTATRTEQTP